VEEDQEVTTRITMSILLEVGVVLVVFISVRYLWRLEVTQ
jgi:hypothetical protein